METTFTPGIRALTHSAILQEALADHMAAAAAEADAAGNREMVKLFLAHSREQRVRVLELQGRLAALSEAYAAAYAPGCQDGPSRGSAVPEA